LLLGYTSANSGGSTTGTIAVFDIGKSPDSPSLVTTIVPDISGNVRTGSIPWLQVVGKKLFALGSPYLFAFAFDPGTSNYKQLNSMTVSAEVNPVISPDGALLYILGSYSEKNVSWQGVVAVYDVASFAAGSASPLITVLGMPGSNGAVSENTGIVVFTILGEGGTPLAISPVSLAPTISSLSPTSATHGESKFTLTVNGANFLQGSTVYWNSTPLVTNYSSPTLLKARVPAGDIAAAGTASVTVFNNTSSGGSSNAVSFPVK
jgi:hypothetical protein